MDRLKDYKIMHKVFQIFLFNKLDEQVKKRQKKEEYQNILMENALLHGEDMTHQLQKTNKEMNSLNDKVINKLKI